MSQFPHDDFVKEYIPELIQKYGRVISAEKVIAQTREIDVFFQPTQKVPTTADTLGLLGRLAQTISLFEIFRNPVESHQILECLGKSIDVRISIGREKGNKREQTSQAEAFLWILTPTLSAEKIASFAGKNQANWEQGIYFLPPMLKTGIVVIHQLSVTKETLWLRLLGKGKVQENAIDEIKALPKNHPERDNVLELVGNL